MSRPLVLLGCGGHAKVLRALVMAAGYEIVGVCDPRLAAESTRDWYGLPVLGDDGKLQDLGAGAHELVNGVGQIPRQRHRQELYEQWRGRGYRFPALVHPSAWMAGDVDLADGVQVMAGSVIQPGCSVGENTLINSGAVVDHDCLLGAHVHIAPGATLCGNVTVAESAFIGAGATVIQGLHIGTGAIVGAGMVCVRNVEAGSTVIGAANRRVLK